MIITKQSIWKEYLYNQHSIDIYSKETIKSNLKDIYVNEVENGSWEIIDTLCYVKHNQNFLIFTERYIRKLLEYYKLTDINELIEGYIKNQYDLNLKWY